MQHKTMEKTKDFGVCKSSAKSSEDILRDLESELGNEILLQFALTEGITSGSCFREVSRVEAFARSWGIDRPDTNILLKTVADFYTSGNESKNGAKLRGTSVSYKILLQYYLHNKNEVLNDKRMALGLDVVSLELEGHSMTKLCSRVTRELKRRQINMPRLKAVIGV